MKQALVTLTVLEIVLLATPANSQTTTNAPDAVSRERPFIAIWEQTPGFTFSSKAPYLRIAIWNDGNVLFSAEPKTWSHDLRRGKIAPYRVLQLKKAIVDSGVFDLKETGIYPVDSPQDFILVDLGTQKQLLSCDEGGLRHDIPPEYRDLKKCWQMLNYLALVASPDNFEAIKDRFTETPSSWFLRERRK